MHGEKISKLHRHMMIKQCKRNLATIQMIIHDCILAPTLDNHVVKDLPSTYHLKHLLLRPTKRRVVN
jgi:hypothetical protein